MSLFNAFRIWLGTYYYPHPYLTTIAASAIIVGICYLTFNLMIWREWIRIKREGVWIRNTQIEEEDEKMELDINEYLSTKEVQKELVCEFVTEGKLVEREFDGEKRKQFNIEIKLPDGKVKTWSMNRTSQKAIAKEYGTETAKWIGKKFKLYKLKQNVKGVMKEVMYAEPVVSGETEVKEEEVI